MDVITTHINADFDCLGAMVAARRLYPEAEMVFPGAQERSLREFFLSSAQYAFNIRRFRDIDPARVTRLILVDVRQSERIGPFAEIALRPGVELHIYDHHPAGPADLRGSFERIEEVGSTVTVLTRVFMERGIQPTREEATAMMLGLYEDTGGLTFQSTTEEDYAAAAFLLRHGAELHVVADVLRQELTASQVSLLNELLESRRFLSIHGIEICIATASRDEFVPDIAVLAHKLRDMEQLRVLFLVVRMGDRVFLVGRSRLAEVNVGQVLAVFGGGGHATAGSASVRDRTLIEVLERLPEELHRLVRPLRDAAHLMSAPVKSLPPQALVQQAQQFLTRYNINAAPVIDEGGRLLGLITRQVVERAAHHGLGREPVTEYMGREVATVTPATPLEEVQELLAGHDQRLVPVVAAGAVVGVVTRTDLLRYLVAGVRSASFPPSGEPPLAGAKRKNILRLMQDQLPERIFLLLQGLGQVAEEVGVRAYLVGGVVRDLLLRTLNGDVDIVVEGDGIAFADAFARRSACRVRAHRKFGTAVLIFADGFKLDIASTRREFYLEPGALPTVERASLRHDLYRRDFTINTLAVELNPAHFGVMIDYFGGQNDLKDRAVRVLHSLSFVEDPTRMFRAVRFEQRLQFRLGRQTEHLLRSAVRMGFLEKVRGPRLFHELTIMLREEFPLRAVRRLSELDLLKCLHPTLNVDGGTERLFVEADRVVHWHELLYLDRPCRRELVYLLCLLQFLDRDAVAGICARLDLPPRLRELLVDRQREAIARLRQMERRAQRKRDPRPSEIDAWSTGLDEELLLYLMAVTGQERVRQWLSHYITQLRGLAPHLTGRDLLRLGVPRGPQVRKLLAELRALHLDGRVTTRDTEEREILRRLRKTPPAPSENLPNPS